MYQAKSANSILESKVKLVCFSFFIFHFSIFIFRFSFFVFHYSFFVFHFSLFDFVIRFSHYFFCFFTFHFLYSFFTFRFSFFTSRFLKFKIWQNLTLKLRQNIVFLHLKSYSPPCELNISCNSTIAESRAKIWYQ